MSKHTTHIGRKTSMLTAISTIIIFIGALALLSANWYLDVYGQIGIDAILYTVFSNINGVEAGLVYSFLLNSALPAFLIAAISSVILFLRFNRKISVTSKSGKKRTLFPFSDSVSMALSVTLSVVLILVAGARIELFGYIKYIFTKSSPFIEENYANPDNVNIVFPEKKQNLIVIYIESLETSFLSKEYGGGNDVNPMPELLKLAEKNTNFSQNETVGGFYSPDCTNWTASALVATTAGIPLKTPFGAGENIYGDGDFLPGAVTLSDILSENGYYQAFMCGSDSSFAGKKSFFESHNTDDVFDLETAKEEGIIEDEHFVWWGMEDLHLFEYAKKKLSEISKNDKPFAFSMLTADTHHIGGYFCPLCTTEFPERYENVIACSSRQVYEFVNWVKAQDFYKNTTIVIMGDHPSMDAEFISNNLPENYERRVYNCFINSLASTDNNKNRKFTALDMFPTILASIGCQIEGDRVGLGVNLYSSSLTLYERFSEDDIKAGMLSKSRFYDKNLLKKSS